jgi:alanine racemase
MSVLCKGRRMAQAGHITMDMTMFEVDQRSSLMRDAVGVEIGDPVTIVGKDGAENIGLDELAACIGTISYDMACRFGMRLEKVYRDRA